MARKKTTTPTATPETTQTTVAPETAPATPAPATVTPLIDDAMGEAITAFVRDHFTTTDRGRILAEHVARAIGDRKTVTSEEISQIRERVNAEIRRCKPEWRSPEGDTPEAILARKNNASKVRVTANRIMNALRSELKDLGVATPEPVRNGKPAAEDAEGRTTRKAADATIDTMLAGDQDAGKMIATLLDHATRSLEDGDYVSVIAACERIMKIQDQE